MPIKTSFIALRCFKYLYLKSFYYIWEQLMLRVTVKPIGMSEGF